MSRFPKRNTTYVAKYEAGPGDGYPKQIYKVFIETGSKATLEAEVELLKTITEKTSLVVPKVLEFDTSTELISESYLLLSYVPRSTHDGPPLSSNPARDKPARLVTLRDALDNFDDNKKANIELRLGSKLRELHAIDNMWFGSPEDEAEWGECISWQEAFTLLLETALMELEARGLHKQAGNGEDMQLSLQELRRALARAIAFYLFDDVEVPSLVWCAGLDWPSNVYVDSTASGEDGGSDSVSSIVFGNWGGSMCIWGDPLMEGVFRAPGEALLEGYGEPGPILFSRQCTKRLWYTAYAALCQWLGAIDDTGTMNDVADGETGKLEATNVKESKLIEERVKRAKTVFLETVKLLKDAPCY